MSLRKKNKKNRIFIPLRTVAYGDVTEEPRNNENNHNGIEISPEEKKKEEEFKKRENT